MSAGVQVGLVCNVRRCSRIRFELGRHGLFHATGAFQQGNEVEQKPPHLL
jgi:hypothetical protein